MLENFKKNFGFGLMRLPMKNNEVDYEEMIKMVDDFMDKGFTYYDTAHCYIDGKSEIAFRECVVKRYPREAYTITNKLTTNYFEKEEEIIPFFNNQLEWCGVDYFDFYLMHAQNKELFEKYKRCHAYEIAFELKKQGKIKHVGLSFHDTADVLDEILTAYPEIEIVQIQLNYLDYLDPAIQGKKCYEVCVKHNKPVIIMEPVKGGHLVNLPNEASELLKGLNNGSNASYAIRYAASFDNVVMVLSGMSNLEQMQDNLSYMVEFKPINEIENKTLLKVIEIIKGKHLIQCTGCCYCVAGCPKNISIPDLFSCLNSRKVYHDWNVGYYYDNIHTLNKGKAKDCIECGKCEQICPQHLPIRKLLKEVSKEFDHD